MQEKLENNTADATDICCSSFLALRGILSFFLFACFQKTFIYFLFLFYFERKLKHDKMFFKKQA